MGISQEYSNFSYREKRRKAHRRTVILFICSFIAILVLSAIITAVFNPPEESILNIPQKEKTGIANTVLAPLPMQVGGSALAQTFGPEKRTENAVYLVENKDTIKQKETGQVSLDYFADAAFIGDSLTVGFIDYDINLGGALVCAYAGIGPQNIVNRTTHNHADRGEEIVLDVLAQNKPKKVYLLLGTNTLVATGNDETFISYYKIMIEMIYEVLGDDTIIYVQSVPPVTEAAVADKRAGLESSRLATINESLAHLAEDTDAVFIDLWEVFADENANLNAELAANDGVHFTAGGGYTGWVNYLRTHTLYSSDNPWAEGSSFDK